jgi:hypothetical protein
MTAVATATSLFDTIATAGLPPRSFVDPSILLGDQ